MLSHPLTPVRLAVTRIEEERKVLLTSHPSWLKTKQKPWLWKMMGRPDGDAWKTVSGLDLGHTRSC